MTTRPLLFLDVDGPLNPYAAKAHLRPDGYTTHRMRPSGWEQPWDKPLRVWLNQDHGAALQALPFELVWATTWGAEANEWIAGHLNLPQLPVAPVDRDGTAPVGIHWKTAALVAYAAGRPFAWVDDELSVLDRRWVTEHHDGPALLHHVKPHLGLLPSDFTALADWANQLPTN